MAKSLSEGHQPAPPNSTRRRTVSVHETTHPDHGDATPQDRETDAEKTSRSRSRSLGRQASGILRTRSSSVATTSTGRSTIPRLEAVVSRVRGRPPIVPRDFTHALEHQKTTVEDLVDFDGDDDPYRAANWSMKKKVITTLLYGFTTMTATWGSSAYSPGTEQVARLFGVGTQVATLGTSLFLFGFGIGPLLWAPLSEVYGRKVRNISCFLPRFRIPSLWDEREDISVLAKQEDKKLTLLWEERRPTTDVYCCLFRIRSRCRPRYPVSDDHQIFRRVSQHKPPNTGPRVFVDRSSL